MDTYMEYINHFITSKSKLNLNELNIKNDHIKPLNKFIKNTFLEYRKFFYETTTEIYVGESSEPKKIRDRLLDFYTDLIDNNADETYDFIKDLNKNDHYYEIYIKGLEMFKFYICSDDVEFIYIILHSLNIFSQYVFNVPQKKFLVFDRILRHSGIDKQAKINIMDYTFDIYIFPNSLERKLAGVTYSKDHLNIYKKKNTAFTTSGVTGYDMVITKKEEINKLMIHELIHLYKLDGSYLKNTDYLKKIRKMMPFYDHNAELECVAEILSNIYNCMELCLIITQKYNLTDQEQFELLNLMINIEKEHSMCVVAKILKYFNIKPDELFNYSKTKIELVSPINLYHIFRSVLFIYFDDFLNKDNINLVNEKILEINDNVFLTLKDLIKKAKSNDSNYMKQLNEYYRQVDLEYDMNISYVTLDIDFNKVKFKNIIIKNFNQKEYENDLKKNYLNILNNNPLTSLEINGDYDFYNKLKHKIQSGGGTNYYYKYLKYKLKYLNLLNE